MAKGTIGVATLGGPGRHNARAQLLRGLERLRLPAAFTTVAGFMVRYLDVIADEVRRMRIARVSRGHDPRWIWQARAVAATARTLFIRSTSGASQVYLAMVSRGYAGSMRGAPGPGREPRPVAGRPVPARRRRPGRRHRLGAPPMTPDPAALEVDGVACAYPDGHQALFGVSFQIRRGSGWPCSAPTRRARPPWCCSTTACSCRELAEVAVAGLEVASEHLKEIRRRSRDRVPGPRRPAVHADGSR